MTEHEIKWQVTSRRRQFHVRAEATNGLAKVIARWDVGTQAVPMAPARVSIARAGGTREHRGVTSGVLRDAEPLVVRMTAELPNQLRGHDLPDPLEAIEKQARALPESPRGNPSYYRQLLALFAAIEAAGLPDPVKTVCRLTGKAEGTVKTQLRAARRGGLSRPSDVDDSNE